MHNKVHVINAIEFLKCIATKNIIVQTQISHSMTSYMTCTNTVLGLFDELKM